VRRLPPLNGVRVFEAAARGGGFARAGAELGLSPAAISRTVALLEARLGVALFRRRPNGLALTRAGQEFLAGLTPLLDALADLTDRVAPEASRRALVVGVGPTFASRWLIPRLAAFRQAHPTVEVRIETGGAAAPFADGWTCGVALGDGRFPDLLADPLFDADMTPVCAPARARALPTPAALVASDLLRVAHAPEDWPRWLAAAGTADITAAGPSFQFYGQAIQAAADGLGVAMGIRPYVDDDLAQGRLVAPFALGVPKGKGWYLVHRQARDADPAFRAFRRWLLAAAG
jgi:LysR family glycine cleavage system transcriptional activator